MPIQARDEELLRHLDTTPPAWVITRTRRLARDLTLRMAALRESRGLLVADTPLIRALDDWLDLLGREVLSRERSTGGAGEGRVLLPASAELLLWERTIRAAPGDLPGPLLDTVALAATASDAWRRVCLWGEPPWSGPLAEDVEAFRRWLPAFRRQLAAGAFVTAAELPGLVADAFGCGLLEDRRPRAVIVLGFEKEEPAISIVVGAMQARGTTLLEDEAATPAFPATPKCWRAATRAAEVRTVASRIRTRMLAEPALRIAVVAADLSAYGKRLERVFEEELDPDGVVAIGAASVRRFDYAEAPALLDYPLVASAIDLLGLDAGPVAFETASRVLLSGFPRDEDSSEGRGAARGALEAKLRRSRSAVLHLAGPQGSLASVAEAAGLGAMALGLRLLAERLEADRGTRRSPSAWRRVWSERLRLLEWPGRLQAESAEGLVFRRWRDAMDEFAMLEAVEAGMDASQALARLREICASTPVQPSSSGLGVRVMNILDATGLDFDVVFAIGMTATAFPPPPRPNPLLPAVWQRAQRGMPRASVEGERELAASLWRRVLASAPEVYASYPLVGDGGEESAPSALIAGLAFEDADAAEGEPWWLRSALEGLLREPRPADVAGPPLVRAGGSSILTNQSNCAFRAFAAARLGAEKLDEIQPQPDASRRGTLMHAALAKAYRDIPTSDDLAGLSDANIDDVAAAAAREAVESHAGFFDDAGDLADAARIWLGEMVAAWMRVERDVRSGSWTAEDLEKEFTRTIPRDATDALTIRFRPDRIDRVEDGALVILDFKTSGTPKGPSLWRGARPSDPQLPLYMALLADDGVRVDGIAFANLSARDSCQLAGVGAREFSDKFAPPGRKGKRSAEDYKAEAADFRRTVAGLAGDYLAGDARVDPKNAQVCKYCGSQALCRVGEGVAVGDDDGGEDA